MTVPFADLRKANARELIISRTNYEVAPDGEGFLMLRSHDCDVPPRIQVILNCAEELEQRIAR